MTDDPQLVLCPYCGHTQADDERCGECGGLFEPLSQRATQIAMGPWYVRDRKRPYHPGCSYEVLKKRIAAGGVRPNSVLRGPTTRQFWSLARNVPGVAHLLGYCHQCRSHVQPTDKECDQCGAPFVAYDERNELGIQFPTHRAAQAAQAKLDAELERAGIKPPTRAGNQANGSKPASTAAQVGTANTASGDPLDLADNLLGDIIPKSKAPVGPPPFAAPNPPQHQGHAAAAPAAKAPTKHPATPATPAAPTDDDHDDADEGSSGISTTMLMVIGLIAINMIALIVILVMLATNNGNTATPNTPPPPPLAPTTDSPTSPGAMNIKPTDSPTVAVVTKAPPPTAAIAPPRPAAPAPQTPAPTVVAAPAPSNATSNNEPITTPADPDRAAVARYFGDAP